MLHILSIHAVGYHTSSSRSAIDRVISSYTSTIKVLAYVQECAAKISRVIAAQGALLIGMAKTIGQNDLPFVEREIGELERLLSSFLKVTVVGTPKKETVLDALFKHQIVHLACHGVPAVDPSESALFLDDWKMAPLTVSDFTAIDNEAADFVYLSSCHALSSIDINLQDESINLSSAIQLSGYPFVIGSLWQVNDKYSAEVAFDVYGWMLEGGKLDTRRSAEGLYRGMRALRERRLRVIQR